jgi:hypothetical protein
MTGRIHGYSGKGIAAGFFKIDVPEAGWDKKEVHCLLFLQRYKNYFYEL